MPPPRRRTPLPTRNPLEPAADLYRPLTRLRCTLRALWRNASELLGHAHQVPREDSDDLRDVDAAVYSRLDDIDPALAILWRGRFLDHFFATSGLSEHRRQEATEMLKLDRGLAADGC